MPASLAELRHDYFLVRHETSTANAAGTIVFDAGVHPLAKGEVIRSVRNSELSIIPSQLVVVTSPRRRCLETTERLVAELGLDVSDVAVHFGLDERNFGTQLEGTSKENYKLVYAVDQHDPSHTRLGVESVTSVRDRVRRVLGDIERRYPERRRVALITHADTAEILIADVLGLPPQEHRNRDLIPKLENAEVRRLGGVAK